MNSEPALPQLDEVRRRHFDNVAPADARTTAIARYTEAQDRPNRWPAWGVAVAVVCAVLLVPNLLRTGEPTPDAELGVAGLSLNQLELPPRPSLAPGPVSTSELSATTSLSLGLPNGLPNLSQLSAPRIEPKETI